MAIACPTRFVRQLLIAVALLTTTAYTQCNTDQNPYCAGNSALEALCCTYPSVCYWSNRNGDAACCPAGTDCSGDGGPLLVDNTPSPVTQVQQSTYYVANTYSYTEPQTSTVTYYYSTSSSSPPPQFTSLSTVVAPGVVVVTDSSAVVVTAAPPPVTNGAFVTVTQVQQAATAARCTDSSRSLLMAAGATAFGVLICLI